MTKFQRYLDDNKLWHFEGEQGVRRLERIAREVGGYGDLREFLTDNPGACESLVDFVREHVPRVPEWAAAVDALTEDEP
jgi:hypothetical protein